MRATSARIARRALWRVASPLDPGEWIGVAGLVVVVGGGVVGGIRAITKKIHDRIDSVEGDMKEWDKLHAAHTTELAVVKTCQENTRVTLDEIKETAAKVNDKLDKVLLAIQK